MASGVGNAGVEGSNLRREALFLLRICASYSRALESKPCHSSRACRHIEQGNDLQALVQILLFNTSLCHQLANGTLELVDPATHLVNAREDGVRHLFESALHLLKQVLHEDGQILGVLWKRVLSCSTHDDLLPQNTQVLHEDGQILGVLWKRVLSC